MAKIKLSEEVEIPEEDYEYLKNLLYKWGICKSEECVKRHLIEYALEEDEEDDDP